MNTQDTPTEVKRPRHRKLTAAATVASAALIVPAGGAFAAEPPADPTGGAFDDSVTSASTWITSVGAPALFGLAAVSLAIGIGMKWLRKARGVA